mmetsp:Transcript_13859/g.44376  ORF Transcript_13859/g.44376 Transcript_13859/m.44376 type:complete len:235 (-) Transcript_13859:698-1402(-)
MHSFRGLVLALLLVVLMHVSVPASAAALRAVSGPDGIREAIEASARRQHRASTPSPRRHEVVPLGSLENAEAQLGALSSALHARAVAAAAPPAAAKAPQPGAGDSAPLQATPSATNRAAQAAAAAKEVLDQLAPASTGLPSSEPVVDGGEGSGSGSMESGSESELDQEADAIETEEALGEGESVDVEELEAGSGSGANGGSGSDNGANRGSNGWGILRWLGFSRGSQHKHRHRH